MFGCVAEMLSLVAVISSEPIFQTLKDTKMMLRIKKKIGAKEGDHLTLLNAFKFYIRLNSRGEKTKFCTEFRVNEKNLIAAIQLRASLEQILRRHGIDTKQTDNDTEGILRCVCSGYFTNAAQKQPDGSYMVVATREPVLLHPTSVLNAVHPDWIVFHEAVRSGASGKSFVRNASEITVDWLAELAPDYYSDRKTEIATQRYQAEVQAIVPVVQTDVGGQPAGNRVEIGVARPKKQDSLRDAVLKKPVNKRVMISDMDFDS
jgi:hypothetical protein